MPSLADHFADMLKDAAFHRSTLDFDCGATSLALLEPSQMIPPQN